MGEIGAGPSDLLNEPELATVADKKVIQAFEVDPTKVEDVKQRCLPDSLNYPMLEEYDCRNDTVNPDLDMELKSQAQPRPYQEKSLSKMFGNGRARHGIIVLPCGAGKSLVGVSAASRIKKSCLCLATNAVSVDQWAFQFKLWSTIADEQICRFTSDTKERLRGNAGVVVATYNMNGFNGKRSEESEKIIEEIRNREWGLLLMDEVGDNSIDIPEANVIIQISSHAGSRRQEAQRLGRILRAKDRIAGGTQEYNAFFYSLVSTDTQEMYFSTKRQQFLIDQGYIFKVITSLPPPESGADLSYHCIEDQLALLSKVLSTGEDKVGLEPHEDDPDEIALQACRSSGSMSVMSGADGMGYMEYSTKKRKHREAQTKSKPRDPAK